METFTIFHNRKTNQINEIFRNKIFLMKLMCFWLNLTLRLLEKSFITLILQNKQMTHNFLRNFSTTFGNSGQYMLEFK